jgi:MFS family permease
MLNPALYAIVARGSPPGRSGIAQGIYGAAGILGVMAASLISGLVAGTDIRRPFYIFAAVILASLGIGLGIGGGALREIGRSAGEAAPASTTSRAGRCPGG